MFTLVALYTKYVDIPWNKRPLLYKLLLCGIAGWIIFILLDSFIFIFAPISFEPVIGPVKYLGYNSNYPSLLISNILRDISVIGLLTVLWSNLVVTYNIMYGNEKTWKKILHNKILILFIVCFSIIMIIGETISVKIQDNIFIVDAEFSKLSGICIVIFLIIYIFVSILFVFSFRHGSKNFFFGTYRRQIKFLELGTIFIVIGFLIRVITGFFLTIFIKEYPNDLLIFLSHFIGHLFWIFSPIFTYFGIKVPFEEINLENENIYLIGNKSLRKFIEQSFLGFLIFKNNKLIYCSERICHIFKVPIHVIKNWDKKDYISMIHPSDQHRVSRNCEEKKENEQNFKKFDEIKNNQKPSFTETKVFRIITKDDNIKWIRQASQIVIIGENCINYDILIDISEQKNLAQKYQESEEKFQNICQAAKDLILFFDSDGIITTHDIIVDNLGH